jgi:hypothetical protein
MWPPAAPAPGLVAAISPRPLGCRACPRHQASRVLQLRSVPRIRGLPSPVCRFVLAGIALAVVSAPQQRAVATSAQAEPVSRVLELAGHAVGDLLATLTGAVLEEDYIQQAGSFDMSTRPGLSRRLRSDLVVTADADVGWVEFRDVYEVDGKAVRDRDDRIVALFAKPSANALDQARRIVSEGARFNLTPTGVRLDRTINLPLAALRYLMGGSQARSTFRRDGIARIGDRQAVVLRFRESGQPRIIQTPDNSAAEGAFWIEDGTGRVLRSELSLRTRSGSGGVNAVIRVDFGSDERLRLWRPMEMSERYTIEQNIGGAVVTMSGRATYSNARKFEVVVEEKATAGP